MSAVRLSNTWMIGASCALVVSLCGLANLHADDYLNKFKAKAQVDAQRVVADVKGLLDQAIKVRNTNPQAAKVLLTDGLSRLDNAYGVNETERTALRNQLQTRLNEITVLVRQQEATAAVEAKKAEDQAIKETRLKAQMGQGKQGQSGAFNQSKDFIAGNNKTLNSYQDIKLKREAGSNQMVMDLHKTSTLMTEERITQRFIDSAVRVGPKLTEDEKKLIKALNSTMSVNFNKHPLKEAIEYIQEKTGGIPIFFDELALKESGIEYDTDPVTFKASKVTVRTILKKICADRGLTFIIKEAAVQVMAPAKAADMMVIRSYPVQDLIQPVVRNQNPYITSMQMNQAIQGLILNIQNAVDPASWQVNGGKGTISFNQASLSLVIRQSAEFHYQMNGLLKN
jgi:hypothetical protein